MSALGWGAGAVGPAAAAAGTGLAVGPALRRSRRRGFLSEVDRATYNTLHTASLASQHLGDGLLDLLVDLRLADHDQGGVAVVEGLAEVLEVTARHSLPEVADDATGDPAGERGAKDRGRCIWVVCWEFRSQGYVGPYW